jgi:hypothetical protein
MKKIAIVVVILILVGVGGTVAALYANIWNPSWNPFNARPNPDVVIAQMAAKMSKLDTVRSEVIINLDVQDGEGNKAMSSLINFSTDADKVDLNNPKSKSDFETSLYSEEISISGRGQAIGLGETLYFKIDSLSLDENELLSAIIPLIEDQWIKIDQKDLEGFSGQTLPEEEQENIINKIKDIVEKKDLYRVVEELPDEEINGKKVYHYLLELDQKAVRELFPEVLEILLEANPEMLPEGQDKLGMKEDVSEAIDEFFEIMGSISFKVWIGQKDNYLYRVKFNKEVDIKEIAEEEGRLSVQAEINFSNFNKPITVIAPQEFITLEDIMQQMMMRMMMGGMDFYGPQFGDSFPTEEMYEFPVEIHEWDLEELENM